MNDDDDSKDDERPRQKGLAALFSSTDDGRSAQERADVHDISEPRNRAGSRIPTYVLSLITLFFLYWMVSTYTQDVYFRNYVYGAFSQYHNAFTQYLPPASLLVIGSAGLLLTIIWGIIIHRNERIGKAVTRVSED